MNKCIIDWLSIICCFDLNDTRYMEVKSMIYSKLGIKQSESVPIFSNENAFSSHISFPNGIQIHYDPNVTAERLDKRRYFKITLTGSVCATLRDAGVDINELLIWFVDLNYKSVVATKNGLVVMNTEDINDFIDYYWNENILIEISRFDVAYDWFNEDVFSLDNLISKLKKGHFQSHFRRYKNLATKEHEKRSYTLTEVINASTSLKEDDQLNPDIYLSRKGTSVTFGSKNSVELQFYDKKAETLVHRGILIDSVDTFTRVELRCGNSHAKVDVYNLVHYLKLNQLDKWLAYKLSGLLRLCEGSNLDQLKKHNNLSRARTYRKRAAFLKQIAEESLDKFKDTLLCSVRRLTDDSIATQYKWVNKSWGKTIASLIGCHPQYFETLQKEAVYSSFSKGNIGYDVLEKVNDFRRGNDIEPDLTLYEFWKQLKDYYCEIDPGANIWFRMSSETFTSKFPNLDILDFDEFINDEDIEKLIPGINFSKNLKNQIEKQIDNFVYMKKYK